MWLEMEISSLVKITEGNLIYTQECITLKFMIHIAGKED